MSDELPENPLEKSEAEARREALDAEFRAAATALGREAALLAPQLLEFESRMLEASELMATDARSAVRCAVKAAFDFVGAHPRWSGQGLTIPLFTLLGTLEELDRGKVHAILQPKIDGVGNRREHGINLQQAKAYTCFFLERLMAVGVSSEEACRALARIWERIGLSTGGRAETQSWKTIREWKNRISKLPDDRPERYLLEAMRNRYGSTVWPDRDGILADFEKVLTALGQAVLEIAPR